MSLSLNDIEEDPKYRQCFRAQRVRAWNRENQPRLKRRRTIAIQTGLDVTMSDIIVFDAQEQNVRPSTMDYGQLHFAETLIQETLVPFNSCH
jgi:hypothetical protein